MMKPSRTLMIAALALMLSACGGGDDDATVAEEPAPAAPAAPIDLDLAEFEGRWVPAPANMQPCEPDFPYDTALFYRGRSLEVVDSGAGVVEGRHEIEVFGDASCTTKFGLLTEIFAVNPEPVTVVGRENVVRGVPTYTGFETAADGGLGMPPISTPDGSLTGIIGFKSLFDVVGNQLFVNAADPAAAVVVDAEGFPTDLDPQAYLVRP